MLAVIGDPSIALMLMLIGFYGLLFEFSNPGLVAPGIIGALCLLVGLYGLQTLPVTGAGIALMLLGLGCFAAEAFVPTHGALGLGGLAAFGLGAVMMIDTGAVGFGISRLWILGLGLVSLGFVVVLGSMGLRARRRPPASGPRMMVGTFGEVLEASGERGWAQVDGERWQVHGARALRAGERVRVTRVDGLVLDVESE
jgi:membrane-bound serine protease (ClpP class)